MIQLNDFMISTDKFEDSGILVGIHDTFDFVDGKKQLPATGKKIVCAYPHCGLRKLSVKIKGNPKIELTDEFKLVKFKNMTIKAYHIDGRVQISANAEDAVLVNTADTKKL